jgi:hypothetical protein
MNRDFDAFLDSADANFDEAVAARPAKPVPVEDRFPCQRCAGTGKYRGFRINQPATECFACGGRGFFKKSYADRMAAKAKREAKAVATLADKKASFEEDNAELIAGLRGLASWHNFARSLMEQYEQRGSLSPNQISAGRAALVKQAERETAKKAERASRSGTVDLSPIRALFETAKENGLKKPTLRFLGATLSAAPEHGRNAGAIYVKREGEYVGKLIGTTFTPAYGAPADTLAKLQEVAADPKAAAVQYGRDLGKCCCCGRQLTDPVSVANGIGPICEASFGF